MKSKYRKSRKVKRNSMAQNETTKGKNFKTVNQKRLGQCEIENEGNMVVNINVLEGGKLILNSSTQVCNVSE